MSNPNPHNQMKPGETRNPNGRPKKEWSLTQTMRDYLSETDPVTKKERRQAFIEKQYEYAQKGDATASKHLWNYIEGMPKQSIDHTTQGEKITPIYGGMSVTEELSPTAE
jgi:hypothetical protein